MKKSNKYYQILVAEYGQTIATNAIKQVNAVLKAAAKPASDKKATKVIDGFAMSQAIGLSRYMQIAALAIFSEKANGYLTANLDDVLSFPFTRKDFNEVDGLVEFFTVAEPYQIVFTA